LDPGATKLDVANALEQFTPQVLVAFRGTAAQGFEAAVADLPEDKKGAAIVWCAIVLDGPSGLYRVEEEIDAGPQRQARLLEQEIDAWLNPAPGNAMLLRTSGTTSKPKIVPLRAGALTSNGAVLAGSLGLRPDDCCINAMPLFHIGGLSCSILATIASGASVTCMPKFDAQAFLDILINGEPQPTWYSAVPTIHLAVLNHAASLDDGKAPASHRLRFIRTGAAALSQFDAVKLMDSWGVPVIPTYSMSEQMPISGSPMEVTREILDGVGMPLCCSLALVPQETAYPVMFHGVGEICISGPNVMSEYQDNPEANLKSYFYIGNERFFRTGDVGTIDGQGILRLVGRSKELIKRGGEQVSPPEVEGILDTHPDVKKALVFAVPSVTWGEEVGAALALREDAAARAEAGGKKVQDEIIAGVRSSALGVLNLGSVPTHWVIVQDSELPKTSTGKYIRTGLAKVLGIEAKEVNAPMPRPPAVSSGLNGLRWLMACGVMFNHIGSATEEEYSYGPVFGQFKSSTFYFPAQVFFVLGGFSLSAGLSARPVSSLRKFYLSRMQTLHPEYLFALLLALINLLIACPPGDFSEKFTFQRESDDLTCQSGAAVVPHGVSVMLSLCVFGFGLQAWPWFIPLTQWLLFYAWFSSVYYFIVATFPPLHNALVRIRGNRVKLLMWFGLATALVYATCVPLACFYLLPEWTKASSTDEAGSWGGNVQNIYALATMIFPPYWLPSSLSGMVAYFLYDSSKTRTAQRIRQYGLLCDLLSAAFLAWHVGMVANKNWPYPAFANDIDGNLGQDHNSGIERYVWSVLCTRLQVPLITLWIMLLAMPASSYTARFFELPLMAETLGPTAYGCFLHHQTVGQWYFWATRGITWDWWSFRKSYYWFSPKPMPGAWYEYFLVVQLVTMFSMLVKAYVTPYILLAWNWLLAGIGRLTGKGGGQLTAELTSLELIHEALEELLGGVVELTEDSSLAESGLGSIGLPALVTTLDSLDEKLHLAVADIAKLDSIGELARLIDEKRADAGKNAGVGSL
jgi:acyl-CoA synthetase (AMP-forming)/AMP-acid ligase II